MDSPIQPRAETAPCAFCGRDTHKPHDYCGLPQQFCNREDCNDAMGAAYDAQAALWEARKSAFRQSVKPSPLPVRPEPEVDELEAKLALDRSTPFDNDDYRETESEVAW